MHIASARIIRLVSSRIAEFKLLTLVCVSCISLELSQSLFAYILDGTFGAVGLVRGKRIVL